MSWRSLAHLLGVLDAAATVGTLLWLLVRGSLPDSLSRALTDLTTAGMIVGALLAGVLLALGVYLAADQRRPPMEL